MSEPTEPTARDIIKRKYEWWKGQLGRGNEDGASTLTLAEINLEAQLRMHRHSEKAMALNEMDFALRSRLMTGDLDPKAPLEELHSQPSPVEPEGKPQ